MQPLIREQTHFFLLLFNINLVRKKLASRKNLESRFRRNVKISERDYSNRPSSWPITLESKFASSNLRFSIFTCVQWKRRWKRDTQREIDVSQDLRIYMYIYIYIYMCMRRKKKRKKNESRHPRGDIICKNKNNSVVKRIGWWSRLKDESGENWKRVWEQHHGGRIRAWAARLSFY